MRPPLVSVVLPVSNPKRINLAKKAVNNFLQQYYTPVELFVVNATGIPVLTADDAVSKLKQNDIAVREIPVTNPLNAAGMRNIALREAVGEWVLPIDDDDWFHPARLLYQLAHCRVGYPCVLKFQLLVDLSDVLRQASRGSEKAGIRPLLKLQRKDRGIPNTVLFPRLRPATSISYCEDPWLYDERLNTGEHEELLARMLSHGLDPVVCNNCHNAVNDTVSWPLLSVAVYHTDNELERDRFFESEDDLVSSVPEGLNSNDMSLLKDILKSYNFDVS